MACGGKFMSNKSKIAVITAASIGMVLTQSSSLRAENEDTNAPEKVTKIAVPVDLDEAVLYSTLPDEVLENTAGFAGVGLCGVTQATCAAGRVCYNPPKPPNSPNRTNRK
jgi:hypothetical protein